MKNDQKEQAAFEVADKIRATAHNGVKWSYQLVEIRDAADTIESLIHDRNALRQTLTKIVEHGVDSASDLRSIARGKLADMEGGNQC